MQFITTLSLVRIAVLIALFILIVFSTSMAQGFNEGYYLYLGDYPENTSTPQWQDDRTQGIGHDDTNWFITSRTVLWKIPVSHDLEHSLMGVPGVEYTLMDQIPALLNAGYNHFGDLDCFEYEGITYLLIPIQGDDLQGIAAFSTDLQYIDHVNITTQSGAGWCAVDPQGSLYSSDNLCSHIMKYTVDWYQLRYYDNLILREPESIHLHGEDGWGLLISDMQGGDFSPSGNILYLSSGITYPPHPSSDGLHVFDVSTWTRIQRSTNGSGYFNYEFDNSLDGLEEPQGLTVWDLDNGIAPGISGQLHVLLYDHDVWWPDNDDEVYIKHYTSSIYVDGNVAPYWPENGWRIFPFHTISNANSYYPIWDGAELKVIRGTYLESITISKKLKITPVGGTVTIIGQ